MVNITHLIVMIILTMETLVGVSLGKRHNLTLAVMAPLNTTLIVAQDVVPAIEMAIQDINNRSDILTDYQLQWVLKDSKCNPSVAMYALVEHIVEPPTKIMFLGGGCSISTTPVARTSHQFNLVQVAYTSTTPELSQRENFPLFYRLMPSALQTFVPPVVALLKRMGWKRVATLHQDLSPFHLAIAAMIDRFKEENITLLASEELGDIQQNIRNIKERDARIIIIYSYQDVGAEALCEMYLQGMTGPNTT